jgi:outer membrane protein assembly factor BamB
VALATSLVATNVAFASDGGGESPGATTRADVSAVAAMAERLFPSGTSTVVLCSGNPSQAGAVQLGQALATKMSGVLLLTENSQHIGAETLQALSDMTVPQVAPTGTIQPFQPQPGKPTVYIVGDDSAISVKIQDRLTQMGYQVTRINGSADEIRTQILNIVAPAIPQGLDASSFPSSWTMNEGASNHESFFPVSSSAPAWVKQGVSWNFAEQAAVPLNASFPDLANLGLRNAPVKLTQYLGNALGVTAVNGVIYAESDDYHLYALNAQTGALIWQVGPLNNSLMGDPIVSGNVVYVTTGDTGFSFSQVLKYQLSGGTASLVRGLLYSSLYAFNATTGRMLWRQDFKGNAMPTPILYNNTVYEPTGGGNLWALNAQSGALVWKTALGGFDSMSSPNLYVNPSTKQASIILGTSDANHVVAVNAVTGAIEWVQPTTLNIFNTGMGDNSPAVDQANGVVIQDSVVKF